MIEKFIPKVRAHSVYDIDWKAYYEAGIRGVIFDIDSTLVAQNAPADEKVKKLFSDLHETGFATCVISNNERHHRTERFSEYVNSDCVPHAGKPKKKAYRKAMITMGTDVHNTVFVGDQLLTDIYGANRAGVPSICVDPVSPEAELTRIKFKRKIEKLIWSHYKK